MRNECGVWVLDGKLRGSHGDVSEGPTVVALRRPPAPISRAEWVRRILHEARLTPGSADFESGFARHLHRLLSEAGFRHAAGALAGAAGDLAARPGERGEYDALVDMGLSLLVRHAEED